MATTITAAAEIERLTDSRNRMRDKLIELGLAVSTDTLDVLAAALEDIINQGAVQVEILEGTSYTIPAGFHNGSGTVKALTDTTGEAEKYKVQAKTITPTKNQQSVAPDTGYYALSAVTVNAIPAAYQNVSSVNAAAGDVLVGKIIVTADGKVTTGTMANNGAVTQLLDCTTVTYTIPVGYHDGKGTVTITLEEKSVTPSKSAQTVTPTSGKVLSKVTVNAIPDEYQDVTGVTATAGEVLSGAVYVNSEGEEVTGTMTNRGAVTKTLDTETTSYTISNGYHNGSGKVSITTEEKTATPTKSEQTITPTSGKVLKKVTVNPIPDEYITTDDATAYDLAIRNGLTAYVKGKKVTGTMAEITDDNVTLTPDNTSYQIKHGYHTTTRNISVGYWSDTITITPSKEEQRPTVVITDTNLNVYPAFLKDVVVNPIPDEYITTDDADAVAANILANKTAYVDGVKVTGSMTDRGAASGSINGLTVTEYTIPAGFHNGSGKITLTDDIARALSEI